MQDLVPDQVQRALKTRLKANGVNVRWRRGYWLSILMRFEALRAFAASLPSGEPVVHIENDVATFLSDETLNPYLSACGEKVLIPFVDSEHACPGIMIAQSAATMAKVCEYVVESVADAVERSDMYALGSLHSVGMVDKLPTRANAIRQDGGLGSGVAGTPTGNVVFDSVVVGQYLFGSDPRNSQGVMVPGYRYVLDGFDPADLRGWKIIESSDRVNRVAALDGEQLVEFASLHVHAKRVIPDLELDPNGWIEVLSWANAQSRPRLTFKLTSVVYLMLFERISPMKRKLQSRWSSFRARQAGLPSGRSGAA